MITSWVVVRGPDGVSSVSSPESGWAAMARASKQTVTVGSFSAASSRTAFSPCREIELMALEPSAL